MPQIYDVVLATPFSNYHFFAHRLRELCGQMNLTFFLADDVWVNEFTQKLKANEVGARVLLDLTANQTIDADPYLILAQEAKNRGAHVIDDPALTATVAHKARFHQSLIQNRVPVPDTFFVNRSQLPDYRVPNDIKAKLGVPFVVKPAWGDSGVGVIVDAKSEYDIHESAEMAPNSDVFLLQKRVKPRQLGRYLAWFRLFYICGEVIPCWWDPSTHQYHLVTHAELKQFRLSPLRRIMRGIARASNGMRKFSSEICLNQSDGAFYAVDYINADPDMNPQSFYDNGVPDEVVRHIVWLLFYEAMHIVKRGHGFFDEDLSESEASRNWLERRRQEQRHQTNN